MDQKSSTPLADLIAVKFAVASLMVFHSKEELESLRTIGRSVFADDAPRSAPSVPRPAEVRAALDNLLTLVDQLKASLQPQQDG